MKNGELKKRLLSDVMIFDGASGTELYRKNYFVNTSYENLVLSNPDVITSIHESYIEAGAEVITTNTFNASAPKLKHFGLDEKTEIINKTAVSIAKKAAAGKKNAILIAGSIGPMPLDIPVEEAKTALLQQINSLKDGGTDFLIFESISNYSEFLFLPEVLDSLKDIAWMPSFVLDAQAKLADETPFSRINEKIKSLAIQPDAIGLNCGTGPETSLYALEKIVKEVSLPIVVQPGAGVPKVVDHRFMPMTTPEYFTTYGIRYANLGARGIGGCCGIASEHIADLTRSLKPLSKAEKSEVLRVESVQENTMEPISTEQKSPFGKMLKDGKWVKLLEMTPPKGIDLSATVEKAKMAKQAGFDAINIPDGPRASCRISQMVTAIEIQEKAGIETIMHCCCRDRNLISVQSLILGCMAKNLRNILYITGDPPKLGDYPFSSGVFDLDSIGLVKLQSRLNRGIDAGGQPLGNNIQTAIVSGVGADPNAIDKEREYRRLAEKIEAGAEFIITQPVFDPNVLHDFLKRIRHFGCPVIAGVWPFASYRNALFMQSEVPGVVVPDWIMDAMKNAGDKMEQRQTGIEIARKILSEIHDEVQGVATSAPFGNVNTAIEVCRGF